MKYNNADMELLPLHLWKNKEADAGYLIYRFFDYTSLDGCRRLLRKWFEAAFAEEYAWEDAPVNLLYFHERFEILLYACWLLHSGSKTQTAQQKQSNAAMSIELSPFYERMAEKAEVLKFLTAYEMQHPHYVLQEFFNQRDVYAWQKELHNWIEAALGKQTITQINNTRNLLPVMEQLNKLAEAAWLINQARLHELVMRKEKKGRVK